MHARLADRSIHWAITGSLAFALQGFAGEVHDIDLQSDREGAYQVERLCSEFVVRPVQYAASARVRSYFGALDLAGVQVEIMGALQKRLPDGTWEAPVDVEQHKIWVAFAGMRLPVLSLAYEAQAYRLLGRLDKAESLLAWLRRRSA